MTNHFIINLLIYIFRTSYLQSMSIITLGYWKFRGLAQYLRHLLAYTGLQFQQVQYDYADQDKWFKEDKFNLNLDFPNLPYLIQGDFKLTESAAIAKYIIKKSGKTQLLGKTVHDQGKVDNLLGVIADILKEIKPLFRNKDYQILKLEQLEKVRTKLNFVSHFIGQKQFALGYLTLVDFILAENSYFFQTLYPQEKATYGFWWKIRHNFEALPQVKAYYTRPDAMKEPFLPSVAALSPTLPKIKLSYWGIRGLAQTPRLLLSYSGVSFEDYHYTNPDKWFKEDKIHLGLDFPNLPYLIDGEYNITESTAIQRYIINKWGKTQLLGKTVQDNAHIESFLSIFTEITSAVKGLFFNKDWQVAKGPLLEKYAPKLEQLAKFVGGKDFVLGYLTLADFIVAEDSHYIEKVYPAEYKSWPFLQKIRENFNKLPEIVAYYEKPTAFKGRFYPESAYLTVDQA